MKQLITSLAAILFIANSYGVNPYNITFTGSGATLQRVRIENITKGTITDMNASDILQLVNTTKIETQTANAKVLKLYPNPMNQSCNIEFSNENTGNVNVRIIDLSGKIIFNYNRLLSYGDHNYRLSGLDFGTYIVQVETTTKTYTNRVVSVNSNKAKLSLEDMSVNSIQIPNSTNTTQKAKAEQVATIFIQYSPGDQFKFIGYSSNPAFAYSTIYASPTATTTYTFNFEASYYSISGNVVASSLPSFVDIMFSVTDVNNKGVDNLGNDDFVVKENNVVVSPSESFRYIKSLNTVPNVIKTVIMIDNSASIGTKLLQIKTAALGMINNIGKNQEIAIYSFSDAPTLLQHFTNDVSKLTAAINNIELGYPSTNLYGSFIAGVNAWQDLYSVNLIQKGFLVMFTDGDDTQASSTLQQAIAARGQKSTYIIGLGADLTPSILNQLANPSPYYAASKVSDLEQIFLDIQKDIYKFANSFYWLNYMSPKRGGNHSLKIEVKNNTNVAADASYQGTFSANGFQSVLSGAYVNIKGDRLYGLDTIRCFFTGNGYSFTYDKSGTIQYANDSLILSPVTYWASNMPVYSWVNHKLTTNNLKKSIYSDVTLFPISTVSDTAKITLTDEANKLLGNKYTNNLVLIIYSDFAGVSTTTPTGITSTNVTLGGEVKSIGKSAVFARGMCWSTAPKPTISNSILGAGSGKGVFTTNIEGLTGNTKYYARAYARNSAGTVYGNEVIFTTSPPVLPTITTAAVSDITYITAKSGGTIISDGGSPIIVSGHCWSTTSNPTTALATKTTYVSQGYVFTSTITGLTVGNTYYVRAYATNSVGTTYGAEVSFSTILPTVTTTPISSVNSNSASSGGQVIALGGAPVTARGVCWSLSPNPTVSLSAKTSNGSGTGSFTSSITGLNSGQTYYLRSYATNSIGTAYGAEVSFTTWAIPIIAPVTTAVSSITATTAISGGNVISDGGTITERGVCWNTSQNPTIALSTKTVDGTGSGVFTSTITGLEPLTTYYVRSYATNSLGTVYGQTIPFTTLGALPTIGPTNTVYSITTTSAISGGNVIANWKADIFSRGVCWSTTSNPTIALSTKTNDGVGLGAFTSIISGLTANTTYYVRAYATNYIGTAYGVEKSFTTLTGPPVLAATTAASSITATSANSGGNVTFDGGITTSRGVCWSTSQNPTIALSTKTADGTGTGVFTSSITGLNPNTTYYVRSYATNSVYLVYGTQTNFTTLAALPTLAATTVANSITHKNARSGGNVITDGGASITSRGVCWSTSSNPTIALSTKTNDGVGKGVFTSIISGLTANTTYYIRSYATNSVGTAYGPQETFSTITDPILNIALVSIPAGTFTMGSPITEANRDIQYEKQYVVTLSAFRMSKYEITNSQYAEFLNTESIGSNGRYAAGIYSSYTLIYPNSSYGLTYTNNKWTPVSGYENHPVVFVTWYGAAEFAKYAGGTLPTEAQWEYACRAGTTTPFSTGTFLSNLQANYNWAYPYNGGSNNVTTYPGKTQQVGTYPANAWGLCDMHGNVMEWCNDWLGIYPTTAQTNPKGAASGTGRIVRGGSWQNHAHGCRSAGRFVGTPDSNSDSFGFRLVFP